MYPPPNIHEDLSISIMTLNKRLHLILAMCTHMVLFAKYVNAKNSHKCKATKFLFIRLQLSWSQKWIKFALFLNDFTGIYKPLIGLSFVTNKELIRFYISKFISIIRIMEIIFCNNHGIINFAHGKISTIAIVRNDGKKLFSLR